MVFIHPQKRVGWGGGGIHPSPNPVRSCNPVLV